MVFYIVWVIAISVFFSMRNISQFKEMAAPNGSPEKDIANAEWHFFQGIVQFLIFSGVGYAVHGFTWVGVVFVTMLGAIFWIVFESHMNLFRKGTLTYLGGGVIDAFFRRYGGAVVKFLIQCILVVGLIILYWEMVRNS